jgi:asparagine synthase (glutamine-hydrolysing)
MDPAARYAHWMSAFPAGLRRDVFQPDFIDSLGGMNPNEVIEAPWRQSLAGDRVDRMLDVVVHTYLPGDLLVKMDIATMAYSVEARSPFLDHHLMEFAASLPASAKLQGTSGKRLLKSALRGVIPDAILDRPKMGFGVPLHRWFRSELRSLPADILLDRGARTARYVRRDAVARMIREHHAETADHSLRLWVLLQLEHWHREVVESSPASLAPATPVR